MYAFLNSKEMLTIQIRIFCENFNILTFFNLYNNI